MDINREEEDLITKLTYLNTHYDFKIFRASNGIFTPNYFDAIMLSLDKFFDSYKNKPENFEQKIGMLKESDEYRDAGLSSYSQSRIENRVLKAFEIFKP